jgi:mono/diheme cytochrome c family protein
MFEIVCKGSEELMNVARGKGMKIATLALIAVLCGSRYGVALPFNDDMVDVQKRTGVMMRQKAPGTVPVGMSQYYVMSKAEAEKLVNPVKADERSIANGKRLFAINCTPCHGDISKKPWAPGYVAAKLPLIPPDPTTEAYKARSDGFFYGTIHFGGAALMPALGWKLSPTEHWDVVNYIRKEQGK